MLHRFAKKTERGRYLFIAVYCLLSVFIVSCGKGDSGQADTSPVSLRLAVPMQPQSAVLLLALERGDFARRGLKMDVTRFPSGKRALKDSLLVGKSDVTCASDMPVALAAFGRSDFKIIARTFSANNVNRIIARKDAGIERPEDLEGKRVATQQNSAVHYFLHLFLLDHNLSEADIRASFMKAGELPAALADGSIDAFSMREPYIGQAKQLLGENAVIFEAPGVYEQMDVVVVSERLADDSPEVLEKIVTALVDVEKFIQESPVEARQMLERILGSRKGSLSGMWQTSRFEVLLPTALLIRMEDQARWSINSEKQKRQVPNYLGLVDSSALAKVRPVSVGLE